MPALTHCWKALTRKENKQFELLCVFTAAAECRGGFVLGRPEVPYLQFAAGFAIMNHENLERGDQNEKHFGPA